MLRPMPYYRRHNYNTNNFHAYAPFIFENNNLIITPEFHSKIQNTWVETELNKVFDSVTVKEGVVYGKVPEVEDVPEDEYDRFFKVYKIFLRWYDADKWYHILKRPSVIVSYDNNEMNILKEICKRMVCGGTQTLNSENKADLSRLITELDEGIKKCDQGQGCFIKMSGASTKHDYKPYAIFSGVSALEHLLPSNRVFKNLDCYNIMVQPWRDDISLKGEFRVFVEDNKVIGIGQQNIYEVFQECISVYRLIYKDIIKMAQDLWDSIKDKLPYTEATLDVWLDNENKMHLIEINTYGIWQAAGASWFDWESDFPKAENIKSIDDVELRLTYPNAYFGVPDR
jgi:hypothetical protein